MANNIPVMLYLSQSTADWLAARGREIGEGNSGAGRMIIEAAKAKLGERRWDAISFQAAAREEEMREQISASVMRDIERMEIPEEFRTGYDPDTAAKRGRR